MPQWLVDLFARYGYAVVFAGVFLENTGLPVPGETALLAGAAMAHFGHLSLGWVIVTAIVGATLGDNLGFAIGRRYGRGIVERHGWRIGLTRARLAQFDRFFERHGARTVFIARFITGLRVFGALLDWTIAVATAGYSLAYSWATLERWIGRTGLIGLALLGSFLVIGAIRARRNRQP
jgi:undecaprenyl-diphosphatase